MDNTPKKTNRGSGSNIGITIITILGFCLVFTALGIVAFLFIRQNSNITTALSTLSSGQSQLYDEFANLSSSLHLDNEMISSGIDKIPVHTIEIPVNNTTTEPESTAPPTGETTEAPTTSETSTDASSAETSSEADTTTEAPTESQTTTTPPTETSSEVEQTTPEETTPIETTPAETTPAETTTQETTPAETTPAETTTQETTTTEPPTTATPGPSGVLLPEGYIQEYVSMWLGGSEYRIPVIPYLKMHNYRWENIVSKSNGLKYYTEDGKKASMIGVDVSSHQKDIDWKKVKASGVEYAIIRVGFRGYGESGSLNLDTYFHTNIQGALKAGLKVGVYFFSQAITEEEAIEEAEFLLKEIEGYNITFPVIYDPEDITTDTARTDGLLGEQITSQCIAFCERIKEEGYTPMIYVNKRWILTRVDLTRLTDYDLWLAAYVDAPDIPYYFTMWQYSATGKVNGIEGDVDLNISFVDYSKK